MTTNESVSSSTRIKPLHVQIEDARRNKGISIPELAKETEVSPIKAGQFLVGFVAPGKANLKKLEQALDVKFIIPPKPVPSPVVVRRTSKLELEHEDAKVEINLGYTLSICLLRKGRDTRSR